MKGRVRILREAEVRAALDMASCIDACRHAFVAYSAGRAELPGVIHLDVPEARGEIHVKAGHLHGAPYYAVKAASGFYDRDPAAIDGLVAVFDAPRRLAGRHPPGQRLRDGPADGRRRAAWRPRAGARPRRGSWL